MNTDVMFSSKTDLWETPQGLFDRLDAEFGFDLVPVHSHKTPNARDTTHQNRTGYLNHGTVWYGVTLRMGET